MTDSANTPNASAPQPFATTASETPERTARVLVIGAGGHVSRHSVPLLVRQGHEVTGLVRNPDHVARIEQAGAQATVRDITELTVEQWAALLSKFDVVVWSAGAGGSSAEATYAVDRDAALRVVEALEQLTEHTPRLLMVSYAGARFATTDDDGAWYAYVESKKAVDVRIMDSDLEQVILGPGMLVDGPVPGYATTISRGTTLWATRRPRASSSLKSLSSWLVATASRGLQTRLSSRTGRPRCARSGANPLRDSLQGSCYTFGAWAGLRSKQYCAKFRRIALAQATSWLGKSATIRA